MSGHQFGGWQNGPRFIPPPFPFNVPMHDFSRPPPPFPQRPPRPPGQFFSRPPPAPPTPSPPVDTVRAQDQAWLSNWLKSKNLIERTAPLNTTSSNTLKLSEVRKKVERASTIIQQLEKLNQEIQSSHDNAEETLKDIKSLKTELVEITTSLEESAQEIQCLVKKRASKRKGRKNRRQKVKLIEQNLMSERLAKHRQIDAWRQEQEDLVLKMKREEDTCREADAILCEVRNKQTDGKSLMHVLQALKKLRILRAQHAADKREFPSEEENSRFEIMTAKLEDLWQLQLDEYAKEEQTLRVMMEKEQVVRKERQEPSALESNLKLWLKALFGKESSTSYEYFLHTSADQDLNALINTRHCWDQFLTSRNKLASPIPVGWVVPDKPTSEDWESLLELVKC